MANNTEDLFWSKVNRDGECWLWRGGPTCKFSLLGEQYARRVSWVIANGSLQREDRVSSTCENTLCVRPEHLYLWQFTQLNIGGSFGVLTIVGLEKDNQGDKIYLCQCSCGSPPHLVRATNIVARVAAPCRCPAPITVGQVFGKLTVISDAPSLTNGKKKTRAFSCHCECGQIAVVRGSHLLNGHAKSCGCDSRSDGSKNVWETEFNNYVGGSSRRKNPPEWKLTLEEFIGLVQGDCDYCGDPPSMPTQVGKPKLLRNGIDRVDNSVGYIISNCVPCCYLCNLMKHNRTKDKFIGHAKKITNHQTKKEEEQR